MSANFSKSKKDLSSKIVKTAVNKEKNSLLKVDAVNKVNPDDIVFALDIGTRTVIGVVGIQEDSKFRVLATEIIEHKSRAMLDGQIHDIEEVARVVKQVKKRLEKKLGINLAKVAIAAAGRVLKTCEVHVERDCDATKEIDLELISSMELEGIQKAQMVLDDEVSKEGKAQFYCVGYSVINYYLNNYVISSLEGHKSKKAGADILATFLPHVVVDSMYTVMGRVGLEVMSLTLEPIAAINVTIPKDLRLLNLALVDVGAGTSDMAITKNGSIVAYGMVPIAGDEITEKIAHHYLVDFNTAEKIKISLSEQKEKIVFTDILGTKREVLKSEIAEFIEPTVQFLAQTISDKILEYNHKAPNAIFLIGGGSQIPGLTQCISSKLELPAERVVVRGREVISNVKVNSRKLAGPDAITPIGIAVTSQMQRGQDFLSVTVNGQKVRLFNSKKLVVADALILIGFSARKLIGKNGKNINYELNGAKKYIKGGTGKSAEIYVNDKPANLETVINNKDTINVLPAVNGEDASLKVIELVRDTTARKINLNGTQITLEPKIFINGKSVSTKKEVHDGDVVNIEEIITINDLLKISEIDRTHYDISVNEIDVSENYVLKDLDTVVYTPKKIQNIDVNNINNNDDYYNEDDDIVESDSESEFENNNVFFALQESEVKDVLMGEKTLNITVNGESKSIRSKDSKFIFVDIFNYLDFDLSKPKGNIVLKLNGRSAGFTDVVKPGDTIDIYWEKA